MVARLDRGSHTLMSGADDTFLPESTEPSRTGNLEIIAESTMQSFGRINSTAQVTS